MMVGRVAAVLLVLVVAGVVLPDALHAWTPATHVYLGQSVLENLALLPTPVADLLRAFPFDVLYGNIAADRSIAKNYAPVSRHCTRPLMLSRKRFFREGSPGSGWTPP